jgi:hypothetical protein
MLYCFIAFLAIFRFGVRIFDILVFFVVFFDRLLDIIG